MTTQDTFGPVELQDPVPDYTYTSTRTTALHMAREDFQKPGSLKSPSAAAILARARLYFRFITGQSHAR